MQTNWRNLEMWIAMDIHEELYGPLDEDEGPNDLSLVAASVAMNIYNVVAEHDPNETVREMSEFIGSDLAPSDARLRKWRHTLLALLYPPVKDPFGPMEIEKLKESKDD